MKILFLALVLSGCADPYADAEKANTVEAWEAFLAGTPSPTEKLKAEVNLEILMQQKAEQSKTIADYDAFIKRFPHSKQLKAIQTARANVAWNEAEAAGTPEAYKKFLDENDFADAALKKKARNLVAVAEYKDKLTIPEVKVEQVNLAENPKGPKDGWGFTAEIANNGDKSIEYLNFDLTFLDAQGGKLKTVSYPLVAQAAGQMPMPEEYQKPLAPGQKRVWSYSTGEVPDGWDHKVTLAPSTIRFVGTVAKEGATPQ
jgi:hypothetical protein